MSLDDFDPLSSSSPSPAAVPAPSSGGDDFDKLFEGGSDPTPEKKEAKKPAVEVRSTSHDPFDALMAKGKGLEKTRASYTGGLDFSSFVAPGSEDAEKKAQERAKAEEKARQEKLKAAKEAEAKTSPGKVAVATKVVSEEESFAAQLTKDGYQGRPFGTAFTCTKCGSVGVSSPTGIVTGECLVTGGAHEWKADKTLT